MNYLISLTPPHDDFISRAQLTASQDELGDGADISQPFTSLIGKLAPDANTWPGRVRSRERAPGQSDGKNCSPRLGPVVCGFVCALALWLREGRVKGKLLTILSERDQEAAFHLYSSI